MSRMTPLNRRRERQRAPAEAGKDGTQKEVPAKQKAGIAAAQVAQRLKNDHSVFPVVPADIMTCPIRDPII